MPDALHPAASDHMPWFITAPGETDVLMIVSLMMLLGIIVGIGVFYFKLHALPERIAHRGQKVQFEIVAVLALVALFTHQHIFWIAALLLALVRVPDFSTPLAGMASSLSRMADARALDAGSAAGARDVGEARTKTEAAPAARDTPRQAKEARGEAKEPAPAGGTEGAQDA